MRRVDRFYFRLVEIERRLHVANQRLSIIQQTLCDNIEILKRGGLIDMKWIEELKEKIEKQTSVVAGVVTLIAEMKDALGQPDVDMPKVQEIMAQLDANTVNLADAMKKGTDAETEKETLPDTSAVTGDKLETKYPTDEEQIDPVDKQS